MHPRLDGALVAREADLRLNLSLVDLELLLECEAGGFLTREEKQEVVAQRTDAEKVTRILGLLRKKSDAEFYRFLVILDKSCNESCANSLREHAGLQTRHPQQVDGHTSFAPGLSFPSPAADPILDSRPIERDVLRHLKKHVSTQWEEFSVCLEFKFNQRGCIAKDNRCQSTDCFMAVITQWLQKKSGTGDLPRTWRALLQAVSDLRHSGIAGEVYRALAAGVDPPGGPRGRGSSEPERVLHRPQNPRDMNEQLQIDEACYRSLMPDQNQRFPSWHNPSTAAQNVTAVPPSASQSHDQHVTGSSQQHMASKSVSATSVLDQLLAQLEYPPLQSSPPHHTAIIQGIYPQQGNYIGYSPGIPLFSPHQPTAPVAVPRSAGKMNVLNPPGSKRSQPPSDDQQPPPKRPDSVQQAPAIDPILDSRPIESDVLRHLKKHVSAQWEEFSIYLRFQSKHLDTIVKDNHNQSDDCFTAVITQWLQKRRGTGDLPRTWGTLLQVVCDLGPSDIAGEVHRALAAGAASTGVPLSQPTPPPQPRSLQQQQEKKEEEEGEVEAIIQGIHTQQGNYIGYSPGIPLFPPHQPTAPVVVPRPTGKANELEHPGSKRSQPPSDDQQTPPKRPDSVQQAPAIDPILDSRPIKSDVLWHLRPRLSAQWKDFSIYLQFQSEQRDTIVKENHYQSEDCFTAVITQWLQKRRGTGDLPRTWGTLLQVVCDLGPSDFAGVVHRALAAASTGVPLSQPTPPPQPRPLQQEKKKEEEEGEVEGFLRPHYTSFLKDIDAQQVAMELNHRRLIPYSVRERIEKALSREKANGCLYDHLRTRATLDSLDAVLSVMLSEHFLAYTRMYQLAKKLQEDLRECIESKSTA